MPLSDVESDTSLAVDRLSSIERARVPILIAQFLPVEICIYYQVVPISTDHDMLVLGMVDPEDLAALDYVGKMLAYSGLKIQPYPLSFPQQQELIAYYFSHPPDPAEVAALRLAAQAGRTPTSQPTPVADPTPAPQSSSAPDPAPADTATASATTQTVAIPGRLTTSQPVRVEDESDETVQQLLNSMLRRALDEKADQIFIEPHDGNTCRVRYRQQGILRDLFKELSDSIRAKLLSNMKRMVLLDPQIIGEQQIAEVERIYRGESLVLQLRVVPQRSKEGAILNILRGDSLLKYQQGQNNIRIAEVLAVAQQTEQIMQQLQGVLSTMVDKLKHYPSKPTADWQALTQTLDAVRAQSEMIQSYQQDWDRLSQE
jgi:type II secretory ATPase GspE/PulE/Tfp pilus assembly ATPase PilB-like protein